MSKVEYSKEFLQISKQLKLSEEEKKAGWTGALDKSGKTMTQGLVFEKDKKFFVLTNKGAQALDGASDLNTAKTMFKQVISAKNAEDFGGLNFSDEALAAMRQTREGGGSEKPTSEAETTVDPNAGKTAPAGTSTVDRDTKLAAIVKEYPNGKVAPLKIQDKDKKESLILLGTKDGGKTYEARDANGQTVALKTPKDPKDLLNDENKKILATEIAKGFGAAAAVTTTTTPDSNMADTRSDAWAKYAADTAAYIPVPVKDNADKDGIVYLHNSGTAEKPSWSIVDFNGNKSPFTPTSTDQAKIAVEVQASVKSNNLIPGPSAMQTPTPNAGTTTPTPANPNSTVGDNNTSDNKEQTV